jgi:5-methylcytosine-specific restriction endonuclease McrA
LDTTTFYGSAAWKATRARVLRRDGYCCQMCGVSVRGKGLSRVDHILSIKARPDLALVESNLRALCAPCDNRRHSEKGRGGVERTAIGVSGFPAGWE